MRLYILKAAKRRKKKKNENRWLQCNSMILFDCCEVNTDAQISLNANRIKSIHNIHFSTPFTFYLLTDFYQILLAMISYFEMFRSVSDNTLKVHIYVFCNQNHHAFYAMHCTTPLPPPPLMAARRAYCTFILSVSWISLAVKRKWEFPLKSTHTINS